MTRQRFAMASVVPWDAGTSARKSTHHDSPYTYADVDRVPRLAGKSLDAEGEHAGYGERTRMPL